MPIIERVTVVPSLPALPAPATVRGEKFLSPDGRYTLHFHSPEPWHQGGALGWKLQVRSLQQDVTEAHPLLQELPGFRGYRLEPRADLWRPDGKAVILFTWARPSVAVYYLEEGRLLAPETEITGLESAQWSPDGSRLLFTGRAGAVLCDGEGEVVATIPWLEHPISEHTDLQRSLLWVSGGRYLVDWERVPQEHVSAVDIFDGATGEHRLTRPLDVERFLAVPRHTAIARLKTQLTAMGLGGTLRDRATADLLAQIWGDWRFDPRSNTLYLETRTPIRAPGTAENELVISIDSHYLAVEFGR